MHPLAKKIQEQLTARANPAKAAWWERYLRGVIPFRGVGIPEIRQIIQTAEIARPFRAISLSAQNGLLTDLIAQPFAEEKLAAILFMQLFWKDHVPPSQQLALISDWLDRRYIFDWNTCDWLCVRVLTPMVDLDDHRVFRELQRWNKDSYLWKARASLVPFAQCKTLPQHRKTVSAFSTELIQREERFAKTAVGWVLREFSRHDADFVNGFLEKHQPHLTREVVKNATKYCK